MKYRKKPVVIEAVQWNGDLKDFVNFPISGAYVNPDNVMIIKTLEGIMNADIGDWIIKGIKGEFYPCKPDIFEATYEKVEQPTEH
jgi:hypothetical protein